VVRVKLCFVKQDLRLARQDSNNAVSKNNQFIFLNENFLISHDSKQRLVKLTHSHTTHN